MKKYDLMFPLNSVASVHGAEAFRIHMLASLFVRSISNLHLKCCFYLIITAPALWLCSLRACIGIVFSVYSAHTLFHTSCLNLKIIVQRVVLDT